jgi:hypothetical protein
VHLVTHSRCWHLEAEEKQGLHKKQNNPHLLLRLQNQRKIKLNMKRNKLLLVPLRVTLSNPVALWWLPHHLQMQIPMTLAKVVTLVKVVRLAQPARPARVRLTQLVCQTRD